MKLAEATVVGDFFGEHPVLLLDDVLSELDDDRQTYLSHPDGGSTRPSSPPATRRLLPGPTARSSM